MQWKRLPGEQTLTAPRFDCKEALLWLSAALRLGREAPERQRLRLPRLGVNILPGQRQQKRNEFT